MKRVLVAPDSFKGTFTAREVAEAIGRGIEAAGLIVDLCPVADGGEGTAETILAAVGGRMDRVGAHDPLGREIDATFVMLQGEDRRAVIDTASASGLALLEGVELDPWVASSAGTGELILAAVAAGAKTILVGVGGSATVDGGRGAIEVIENCGGVGDAEIIVLCDVQTRWEDCVAVFGRQKGAMTYELAELQQRLDLYAQELPRDPRGIALTGAAGGLSGGLWACANATLRPGAPFVLDTVSFNDRVRSCDAVVVGEGRLDEQSVMGKIVGEITQRAMKLGVPVHAIVGQTNIHADDVASVGIDSIRSATNVEELESAGEALAREIAA